MGLHTTILPKFIGPWISRANNWCRDIVILGRHPRRRRWRLCDLRSLKSSGKHFDFIAKHIESLTNAIDALINSIATVDKSSINGGKARINRGLDGLNALHNGRDCATLHLRF